MRGVEEPLILPTSYLSDLKLEEKMELLTAIKRRASDVNWNWKIVPLLPAGIILALSIFYTLSVHTVFVSVDGYQLKLRTSAVTVREALTRNKIPIREGDEVTPFWETKVREGMRVEVQRGIELLFSVDGSHLPVRTNPSATVEEALSQAGILLGEQDKLSVSRDSKIWDGLRVKVTRVTIGEASKRIRIEPMVEYINDHKLEIGVTRVAGKGEAGEVEERYQVIYEDGKEVKRILQEKKTVKQMVKKKVLVGTKPRTLKVANGQIIRYTKLMVMDASAYTPGPESCGIYADGYTATGKKAGYGVVAVDPKVIRLGTKLYIEGYGFAEAADVGSAIKRNRIDLCYETVKEALLFGRRKMKVYILASQ